jgi:hypothetical protein
MTNCIWQRLSGEANCQSDDKKISHFFMGPKGLLPCSEESSTRPCPEPDESTSWNPILMRDILIFFHLNHGNPCCILLSDFPIKLTCTLLLFHACYMLRTSLSWFDHPNILRRLQIIKFIIMQCLLSSFYSFSSKYMGESNENHNFFYI